MAGQVAGPAAVQTAMSPVAALTDRLIAAGVSRAVAEELVQNHNAAEVEHQLEYLPYVEDLKNPGGYLRQAIEQGYAPPPKYPKQQKKPARRPTAKSAPERISRPTSLGARGQTESSSGNSANLPADINGPADFTDRMDLSGVPEELRPAWERVLSVLAAQANRPAFEAHIRPLLPLRLEEGKSGERGIVYVQVPSAFTRDWVLKHYRDQIAQVLGEALDPEAARGIEVRFALQPAADADRG
jgi:hypothetical protein